MCQLDEFFTPLVPPGTSKGSIRGTNPPDLEPPTVTVTPAAVCAWIHSLLMSSLTCGIGANGPVDPVLSLKLRSKRSSMAWSIRVHYVKLGRKRVTIAQTDFPLLDHRTMVIHI